MASETKTASFPSGSSARREQAAAGVPAAASRGLRPPLAKPPSYHQPQLPAPKLPAAKDRLSEWAPGASAPAPLHTSDGLAFDPSGSWRKHTRDLMELSLEDSTRGDYGSGLKAFREFCDGLRIPEASRYPISEDLLLAFVSSFAGKVRTDTVKGHLTALATWHRLWGRPWIRFDSVSIALKGLNKVQPPAEDKRPPILARHLLAVRAQLDVEHSPLHAAVWACAVVAWWNCCRLGELLPPSRPTFRNFKHPSRAALAEDKELPGGVLAAELSLPWTKTTAAAGLKKFITGVGGVLDPLVALKHHLRLSPVAHSARDDTHLFAYCEERRGAPPVLLPLPKDKMLATFNKALAGAGLGAFTGHSFRIGGATAHWHAGASLDEVKLIGGWKSDCVVVYLRDYALGLLGANQRTADAVLEEPV